MLPSYHKTTHYCGNYTTAMIKKTAMKSQNATTNPQPPSPLPPPRLLRRPPPDFLGFDTRVFVFVRTLVYPPPTGVEWVVLILPPENETVRLVECLPGGLLEND